MLDWLDPEASRTSPPTPDCESCSSATPDNPAVENAMIEEVGGTGLAGRLRLADRRAAGQLDATPDEVHEWWIGLAPAQQLAMTLLQGDQIGNRDGIPAEVAGPGQPHADPAEVRRALGGASSRTLTDRGSTAPTTHDGGP